MHTALSSQTSIEQTASVTLAVASSACVRADRATAHRPASSTEQACAPFVGDLGIRGFTGVALGVGSVQLPVLRSTRALGWTQAAETGLRGRNTQMAQNAGYRPATEPVCTDSKPSKWQDRSMQRGREPVRWHA